MNKKESGSNKLGVFAGITALAAAAAGAYYLYGTEAGNKKRKQIKSWTLRMKADVLDKVEDMKEWSQDSYNSVVDGVATSYETMKHVDKDELSKVVKDLKGHWRRIKSEAEAESAKAMKKSAKKDSSTEDDK